MDNFKSPTEFVLGKSAKVRLILFAAILLWCSYLSVGYAYSVSLAQPMSAAYIDPSSTDRVMIDGSDFTFAVFLLGHAANAMLTFMVILPMMLCAALTAVLSLIPVLLLRFIGIRRNTVMIRAEYGFTLAVYFFVIGASVVAGLFVTGFTAFIPLLLYTSVWAAIALIYLLPVRSRSLR